jgi:hypothetical protein
MTVSDARANLASFHESMWAVVQRQVGFDLMFYAFNNGELRKILENADPERHLEEELELDHLEPCRVEQSLKALAVANRTPAVLVADTSVVGLLLPDANDASIRGTQRDESSRPGPVPGINYRSEQRSYSQNLKRLSPIPPKGITTTLEKPPSLPVEFETKDEQPARGKGVLQWLGSKFSSQRPSGATLPGGFATAVNVATMQQAAQAQSLTVTVNAPEVVKKAENFDLKIDLSYHSGATSLVSALAEKPLRVEVNVIADGFSAPHGKQHSVDVGSAGIKKTVTVPLIAPVPSADVDLTRLNVLLSSRGQSLGMLTHRLGIVNNGAPRSDTRSASFVPWIRRDGAPPQNLSFPDDDEAPDLTVCFVNVDGNNVMKRFAIAFDSPHAFQPPAGDLFIELDKSAEAFALELIQTIDSTQGNPLVDNYLQGLGDTITNRLPKEFWRVLNEIQSFVRSTHQRPMTLWLKSSEYYVPWELAFMDAPFDDTAPPFLGAQVNMARWLLLEEPDIKDPARKLEVDDFAVFPGNYDNEQDQLPRAVQEAKELEQEYQAKAWKLNSENFKRFLDGKLGSELNPRTPQAVHFACHGEAKPMVLYLDDGTRVLSIGLRSARWARKQRPFLFVNACQVGSAGALLGEWSGFAGNSIHGGFGAFLAPLWSVIDEDAKDFALGFYHSMLAEQKTPEETLPTAADVLRRLRGGYKSGTKLKATYLAYVFYGHPLLRVRHGAKKQLQSAL